MTQRAKISLMLCFFSICSSAALLTYYASDRNSTVSHKALYEVVCRQLNAFQHDDFNRAYDEASRAMQRKFSLDDFTQMIRTNYSGIVETRHVELGAVRIEGDRAYVEVFFVDHRGVVHPCIYILQNEGDTWKVDGARMKRRWPAGMVLSGTQT